MSRNLGGNIKQIMGVTGAALLAAFVVTLLSAGVAKAGEIYVRETFEAATPDGRVLPTNTTGVFPTKDIGHPNSTFFPHDQGMIAAGLAGSKQALRMIDSAEGNSSLRVDWLLRDDIPVAQVLNVQFDLRFHGITPSPRIKSVVPFQVVLRDKEQRAILTTYIHNDLPGKFAVRSRGEGKNFELNGDGGMLENDHDYRLVYLVDLKARTFTLTITDLDSKKVVIAPTQMALPADLPEGTVLKFVSFGFGAPDFASKIGSPDEYIVFDNLLVCDPDVKDGLGAPSAGN